MSDIVRPYTVINEAYFKAYCPVPMNFNMEEILPFSMLQRNFGLWTFLALHCIMNYWNK